MPVSKKYTNVKMGLTVPGLQGPQTIPATQVWVSTPVPVKGARAVMFKLVGTDVGNSTVGAKAFVGNVADGSFLFDASSVGFTVTSGAVRLDKGGLTLLAVPTVQNAKFYHDFCGFQVTANATNPHTGVTLDIEVFYDGDAGDVMQSVGQGAFIGVSTL